MRLLINKYTMFLSLLAALSTLSGQTMIPDAGAVNPGAPGLAADVTTTTTNSSPFGVSTQKVEGKYYRSSDGKTRQDMPNGSFITDPKSRLIIQLNHVTKEAIIRTMPAPPQPKPVVARPPQGPPAPLPGDLGIKQIAGVNVHGHQFEFKDSLGTVTNEQWMSDELKLPVYMHSKSQTKDTVQAYTNIQVGDPDPSVFQAPPGYTIKTAAAPPSQLPPAPVKQ